MQTRTTLHTTFSCSLSRAFQAPLLSDLAKVHTGFGLIPAVVAGERSEPWGHVGDSKLVQLNDMLLLKRIVVRDTILARAEDRYWKWSINELGAIAFGFERFDAEWSVAQHSVTQIDVMFRYTTHSGHWMWFPLHWLITKTLWRAYMMQILSNVKGLAEGKEEFAGV